MAGQALLQLIRRHLVADHRGMSTTTPDHHDHATTRHADQVLVQSLRRLFLYPDRAEQLLAAHLALPALPAPPVVQLELFPELVATVCR